MSEGQPQKLSGSEGIWIFVFIDMLIYGLIFLAFLLERSSAASFFRESQTHLNSTIGLINTLVLMVSSWCVVSALDRARTGQWLASRRLLYSCLALGGVFGLLKMLEYWEKFHSSIDILGNSFFQFYFFITFVHFLHVAAGMLVILVLAKGNHIGSAQSRVRNLESAGLFWHYVDVLWVFIFTMLYLIG